MIEPMQSVVIVCMRQEQVPALERLRELECLHVRPLAGGSSPATGAISHGREELAHTIDVLSNIRKKLPPTPAAASDVSYSELLIDVRETIIDTSRVTEELENWRRAAVKLAPWGDYDHELLERLQAAGLDIRFCMASQAALPTLPEHAAYCPVSQNGDTVYFIVVSDQSLDDVALPELSAPPVSQSRTIQQGIAAAEKELTQLHARLTSFTQYLPLLRQVAAEYEENAEFVATLESMGRAEQLSYICGYVPSRRLDALRAAAEQQGWALRMTPPDDDDCEVPTLLTIPPWLRIATPLFEFVGITPGYREFDVSAWFLVFFAIFFAMIIGDGGYGLIILAAVVAAKLRLGKAAQTPLNLVLILSVCTIVWGLLSGNFFGVRPSFMPGIAWFHSESNVQFLCFIIGAVHLSIAHAWKGLVVINSPRCLSQLGWIIFIWANFLLASMLVTGMALPSLAGLDGGQLLVGAYVVAALLVLFFTEPRWNPLRAFLPGFGSLLGNGINSFVDVLSYIRLFAVGLSSLYLARTFNDMGLSLFGNPILAVVGVGVIIFGHVLNLTLCGLGVLVHGIRLNTLEFSGHIGVEWAGVPFRAFARRAPREEAISGKR